MPPPPRNKASFSGVLGRHDPLIRPFDKAGYETWGKRGIGPTNRCQPKPPLGDDGCAQRAVTERTKFFQNTVGDHRCTTSFQHLGQLLLPTTMTHTHTTKRNIFIAMKRTQNSPKKNHASAVYKFSPGPFRCPMRKERTPWCWKPLEVRESLIYFLTCFFSRVQTISVSYFGKGFHGIVP